jgi:hypothetical protein
VRQSSISKGSAVIQNVVMRNTIADSQASLGAAKVTKDLGASGVELEIGNEVVAARLGFGCLIRPVAGDHVLAVRTPRGIFVLTVLDRLVPDSATLSLPLGGALVLEATDIRLEARQGVSIDARSVDVRSKRFTVVSDSLTLFGRVANWVAEQMRISAKTQETVADTLSAKAFDRIVIVERSDVLRAGNVSQTIDNVSVTTAPAVVIATTEDLRLDGKRVTVG